MPLRVCDRCIRKKVRCNLARPTCSRCDELGEKCTYTIVRRRPGPSRGAHYVTRQSKSRAAPELSEESGITQELKSINTSINSSPRPTGDVLQDTSIRRVSLPGNTNRYSRASPVPFSATQEEYLTRTFFEVVQDANPIFSRERFISRYKSSLCNKDLISTMILITAKLTQFAGRDNDDDGPCLDAALESLLTSSLLEDDLTGDKTSLDQVRKAYLLAFYELHQSPGHSSWLRISKVTRMAYRLGLDRLDQVRVLYPDWNAVSDEDTEEWRALWWRIYRLDTYSNLASGTPYLIDEMIINTTISLTRTEDGVIQGILLPPHSDGLLEIIPAIISNKETLLDNIHTVTTAIMRQVGRVIRMHMLQWHDRVMLEAGNTEQRLATLCLALPLGWLNPQRNAFANEGAGDHHARLITVFHLRMAQLLLSIVECGHRREDDWLPSWQRVLSTSRDIATLAYQWDSAFCLSVDPAITFILFTALVFLDLHRKSSTSDENLRYNLSKDVTVLQLQLKHFGSFWMQARLLTLSFESFSQSMDQPLDYNHINSILSRFEAPLHPRWLEFLSSAQCQS